jgi:branched-subunit amino acid aminotransferase/4-amino-4-deoxychorismate lyase
MNRGQLYGDGFFESMLVVDGAIPLIHLHYERILRTANKLKLVMPDYLLSRTHFSEFLCSYYSEHFGGRLRLNVIRDGGGLYFPESNQAIIQISLSDFDNSLNILKIHKNNVAFAQSLNLYSKGLGNFKLLAKSEQVLLSIERQERDLDDLIVLNEKGEIVECISSNIFFIDYEGRHYTPSLDSGCLEGVMRQVVIEYCKENNILGEEVTILPTHCKQFISAYCTNAVQGIVPIAKIEDVYFDMKPAFMFSDLMNKQILKS